VTNEARFPFKDEGFMRIKSVYSNQMLKIQTIEAKNKRRIVLNLIKLLQTINTRSRAHSYGRKWLVFGEKKINVLLQNAVTPKSWQIQHTREN
jgi:hypothetical protein